MMDVGTEFDRLVDTYLRDHLGADRAEAIQKVADSPAGRDLIAADRVAMTGHAATPARLLGADHDEVALRTEIRKRDEIEELIEIGARDLQRHSDEPLGDGEALEQFLSTPTGKALYGALTSG